MSYYKNLTAARKFQGGGTAQTSSQRPAVRVVPVLPNTSPKNAFDKEIALRELRETWQGGANDWAAKIDKEKQLEKETENEKTKSSAAIAAELTARAKLKAAAAKTKADADAAKTAPATPAKASGTKTTTPASTTSSAKPVATVGSGKSNSERAKIIRIQRTLGVRPDGIWGPKTQAAFDTIKATQESLGFTGKDVDGIQGPKTRAAINTRLNDAEAQVLALKAPSTFDKAQEPIRFIQPTKTDREVKREARQIRRDERHDRRDLRRSIRDEELDFAFRSGGIFYSCKK